MCGIAGFVNFTGVRADPALLNGMIGKIRHRGPDRSGIYANQEVGLAHARLSVIDLVSGAQPMHNESRSLWIIFNGEIFNYMELRRALQARGRRFATQSDTEVILHLYEEKGEECVHDLNGQWAFAIWDAAEHKLFVSRDRMGMQPLFYSQTGAGFVFASEIKAILAHPGVQRGIDLIGLDQIFTFWCNIPPRTVFQAVCELPPGHSLSVQGGKLSVRQYWGLNYDRQPREDTEATEQECAEQLRELLLDATRIRLRADVPVGVYLSGGLDSSVVAALVARLGAVAPRTFSVAFDDPVFDESGHQREVARFLGAEHHEIRCSEQDISRVFPDVIWHAERPVLRTAPAPLFLLSRLVKEAGHKVVLTGEGSDEILGGYDTYKEAKVRLFCASKPHSRLRPLLLKRLYPYMRPLQKLTPAYLQAFFGTSEQNLGSPFFSHLPRWELTSRLKLFYSPQLRGELQSQDRYRELEAYLPERYPDWDRFSQAQYLEARYLLPGYILSSQGDRMAMAHGVEGRFPFLDHRIVELSSRIPARLKMKVLDEKFVLKSCAADLIPPSVKNRSKQPFRAPDARSFCAPRGPEYVEALLAPERIRRNGLFDAPRVQRLVAKVHGADSVSFRDNMAFIGILSTQLLMEQFIDVVVLLAIICNVGVDPSLAHLTGA